MAKLELLKIVLWAVGLAFIGLYAMVVVWPSGWVWTPDQSESLYMILGVYVVLGLYLIKAARGNPLEHSSLIWFTVWSSVVHGGIMLVEALIDESERGHLIGDIPALFIVAAILAYLMRAVQAESTGTA